MEIDFLINELKKNSPAYIKEIKNTYQCDDTSALNYLKLYYNLLIEYKSYFPHRKNVFILRAPGRVNLIGEHTDYNALPVLPIAIDKNIIVIFSPNNESVIRAYNHDSQFNYREFEISDKTIPYPTGDWGNYIKAGVFWLSPDNKKGFDALFYGDIPSAAGLSSSSALVVSSALTFLHVNNINFDKILLAEELAKAEQYVGTMGGGMDQTISLFGKEGKALYIDFYPLNIKEVNIPNDICFVVINSMIKAPKTETARLKYNRRPIECKIITAFLNKFIKENFSLDFQVNLIGDFKKKFEYYNKELVKRILESLLSKDSYSYNEIIDVLGIEENNFKERYLKLKDNLYFPEPEDGFKLRQRFQYVIEESDRVDNALKSLDNNDTNTFGQLMIDSYNGAKNLYEISCPEIDFLVSTSLKNGALGSRLTGAGFGGCVINVLKQEDVFVFIEKMKKIYFEEYLQKNHPNIILQEKDINSLLFTCKPCKGAGVLFSN